MKQRQNNVEVDAMKGRKNESTVVLFYSIKRAEHDI